MFHQLTSTLSPRSANLLDLECSKETSTIANRAGKPSYDDANGS